MKQLTEVSETALITLRSRAMESQKGKPLIHDSVGEAFFQKISGALPPDLRKRILERKLSPLSSDDLLLLTQSS